MKRRCCSVYLRDTGWGRRQLWVEVCVGRDAFTITISHFPNWPGFTAGSRPDFLMKLQPTKTSHFSPLDFKKHTKTSSIVTFNHSRCWIKFKQANRWARYVTDVNSGTVVCVFNALIDSTSALMEALCNLLYPHVLASTYFTSSKELKLIKVYFWFLISPKNDPQSTIKASFWCSHIFQY